MSTAIPIAVSPGELIDKLTILEIKLDRIGDAEKRRNVEIEYATLRSAYETHVPASLELCALFAELRQINLRLWVTEDEIRACERRQDFGAAFVSLARSVYLTNDRRSALKREINALLRSNLCEEKSYTPY